MKTLTVKLPDSLDEDLEKLACRRRVTKSAVIREALARYVVKSSPPAQRSFTALAGDLMGCVEGPEDLATNKDHLAGYGR